MAAPAEDLGALFEFGPRLKIRVADIDATSRLRAELPLRAVIEARGGLRRQGWTFEVVADLGSGMNYHKKGLRRLLDAILESRSGTWS